MQANNDVRVARLDAGARAGVHSGRASVMRAIVHEMR